MSASRPPASPPARRHRGRPKRVPTPACYQQASLPLAAPSSDDAPSDDVDAPSEPSDDVDDRRAELHHQAQLARLHDLAPLVSWGGFRDRIGPRLARLVALADELGRLVGELRGDLAEHNELAAEVAELGARLHEAAEVRRVREGELLALVAHALGVRPSHADWLTPSKDPEAHLFRLCRLMGEPEAYALRDDPALLEVLMSGDVAAYRRQRAEAARAVPHLAGRGAR